MIVRLNPSRWLAAVLVVVHCMAAIIVGLLSLPYYIQIISVLLIISSLLIYLGRDVLLCFSQSIVSLRFTEEVNCIVENKCGQTVECVVLGSTFVSPYLTVLILQSARRWFTRSVVIVPDMVDTAEFRRLRVLLRWKWKPTF